MKTINQTTNDVEIFTVTYTKIITLEQQLQKHQINILLSDPDVKSINIKK